MNDDTLKAFNEELNPLLEKYKVILSAEAYLEQGLVMARPVLLPRPEPNGAKTPAAPTVDAKSTTEDNTVKEA